METKGNNSIIPSETYINLETKCSNVCCFKSGKFKRCAGCRILRYCSNECQEHSWPKHKAVCKLLREHVKFLRDHVQTSAEKELPRNFVYESAWNSIV